MKIFPAVDVLGGQVVRLHQGDYDKVTVYGDDPVAAALQWMARGAEMVHVVDLDGARDGSPSPALWSDLASAGVTFQVGGGLRSRLSTEQAIEAGASRVLLGTVAVHEPELVGTLVESFGSDLIAVSIDIRHDMAEGAGWLEAGRSWRDVVADVCSQGVSWIVTTAIQKDGTMEGPDLKLIEEVIAEAPTASVVAAGGIGSNDDIDRLESVGAAGAIVGRALYEGRVDFQ